MQRLHTRGVTANQVTLAAAAVSLLLGALVAAFAGYLWLFALIPLWMLLRMALNAIDGMLAREFGQQSVLGAYLNELCDVIADSALLLPFAVLPEVSTLWVVLVTLLAVFVEYAGVIPRLERLAAKIGDDDLVIMESQKSSDLHVLGLPLAYIYAKHVVVLTSDRPPAAAFDEFAEWAVRRYSRVLYLGESGKDLLSRRVDAAFVASDTFTAPEYERSRDRSPRVVRYKVFTYGLWQFVLEPPVVDRVRVEVGGADDFTVGGFFAKETNGRFRFRWSMASSELRLRLPGGEPSQLTLWMGKGVRPPGAIEARVSVYVEGQLAGTADVTSPEPEPFAFSLPSDAAGRASRRDGFVVVRIETPTWNPARTIRSQDDRELGVILTAVELR